MIASSPFIEANLGLATAVLISAPGRAFGTTRVNHSTGAVYGFEALGRARICGDDCWRLDGLAGYRYRGFNERLDIYKTIFPLNPLVTPGTSIICDDNTRVENTFCGAAVGLDWQAPSWTCA